jgi:hypothetical protein
MATKTTSRPTSYGPPAPRSPTLSVVGMILPVHEASHDLQRPPSPPFYTQTDSSYVALRQNRHLTSPQIKSPPLSAQSSHSTLRTMADDSGAANKHAPIALASSPTLSSNSPKNWTPQNQRRASDASSLLSEDFENWPGFDSHDRFDDSGLGLEEQEKRDHFPGSMNTSDEMETERWLNRDSSGSDEGDDPYSSAALSRRAEIILANAKKRLNVRATVS